MVMCAETYVLLIKYKLATIDAYVHSNNI